MVAGGDAGASVSTWRPFRRAPPVRVGVRILQGLSLALQYLTTALIASGGSTFSLSIRCGVRMALSTRGSSFTLLPCTYPNRSFKTLYSSILTSVAGSFLTTESSCPFEVPFFVPSTRTLTPPSGIGPPPGVIVSTSPFSLTHSKRYLLR